MRSLGWLLGGLTLVALLAFGFTTWDSSLKREQEARTQAEVRTLASEVEQLVNDVEAEREIEAQRIKAEAYKTLAEGERLLREIEAEQATP
jgi:outer membrane murein-binding lipoprotein Lpp